MYKMIVGNVNKQHETEYEIESHWEIEDFLSYSECTSFVTSPSFSWSTSNWDMQMTFNCKAIEICLYRSKPAKPLPVVIKFGILRVNGSTELRCCLTKNFDDSVTGFGTTEFILKSQLLERQRELLKSGSLTISCSLAHQDTLTMPENSTHESLDVLSSNLKTLYDCNSNSDITIIVGEQKYFAHKIILEARSSVFAAMFRHDMEEVKSGIINVSDCDPSYFNDFLLFLYTGKIENLSSRNVCHLYKIADKYNVEQLKNFCVQYMKKNLSPENLFDIYILANQFDETEIISVAQDVFNENASEIIQDEIWEQFIKENFPIANELLVTMLENMKTDL